MVTVVSYPRLSHSTTATRRKLGSKCDRRCSDEDARHCGASRRRPVSPGIYAPRVGQGEGQGEIVAAEQAGGDLCRQASSGAAAHTARRPGAPSAPPRAPSPARARRPRQHSRSAVPTLARAAASCHMDDSRPRTTSAWVDRSGATRGDRPAACENRQVRRRKCRPAAPDQDRT